MKLNKYSWLAVLPMIFTACQEDTLVKEQQQDNKIYTLSATMDGGAAMSRAQIVIGNDAEASAGETFFWNAGDAFDMYQEIDGEWQKVTSFNISEIDEDGASATFIANEGEGAYADKPFKAFYPANSVSDGHFGRELTSTLDFSGKDVDEVWSKYFQENMLMMIEGESLSGENLSLAFEHLCALARISYTNETGEEQEISGFHLSDDVTEVDFGNGYGYQISTGNGSVGVFGQVAPLSTSGLKVPAGKTIDLYLLLFPTGFEEFPEGNLYINIEHGEGEIKNIKLPFSDIIGQNESGKVFEAGKRYWFKVTESPVGLSWTNKSVEIDKLEDFKAAMENSSVVDIVLKNPIVIEGEPSINTNGTKRISMAHDFTWSVNDTEYDALIINKSNITFYDCMINGKSDAPSKYLLATESGEFNTQNIILNAGGNMNGLKVENSTFWMYFSSSITVENPESYSVYAEADNAHFNVLLEGTVTGNVNLVSNYYDIENNGSSNFTITDCTLNGDILTEGNEQEHLNVSIEETAVYNGNRIAEVGSVEEVLNFKQNKAITELKLKNPIVITVEDQISLGFSNAKTISMSDDFSWIVNDQEYDALIVNKNSKRVELSSCTIDGSSDNSSKYLLATESGEFNTQNIILNACGNMNGLKVENSTFWMYFSSSITVEDPESYSVYAEADNAHFNVLLQGTVTGNVNLVNNYYDEANNGSSGFDISGCTLNGNILTGGNHGDRVEIIGGGGSV